MLNKDSNPKAIFLKDYKAPEYSISDVYLTFFLHGTETIVESRLKVKAQGPSSGDLVLNGEELGFLEAKINGKVLGPADFVLSPEHLTIKGPPKEFELCLKNSINPEGNTALDGLYKVGNLFCSQNEPEGFRRITYFIDRPDIMARYTTKIIADKKHFPVLLSNGNPISKGDLDGGRHFVEWQDPFPKPSYLYALVAGDLGLIQDHFITKGQRKIDLRIYCDKGNESKCHHAMESLKNSMKWDEDTFGLEYDLDIFMIVAVDAFNMGAMENKGLNIFNSVYVLVDPKTATDANFQGIEAVIGHEYFHNWTGNRVTCRDWFQLTLKEGLTVFRDQEFSSDMGSRPVERIHQVSNLRSLQFLEDQGPNAHPIRPDSYIEINNFYTPTVYEKGAEVIRMAHTFLGKEGFRKGMDNYFKLYDGQAVTTDDFIQALSSANNNFDFGQFRRWYSQAGTPRVKVGWEWKKDSKQFSMTVEQSCPSTPGQPKKDPFHFPLSYGLVSKSGADLKKGVLSITKEKETFVFDGIGEDVVPSLNRSFSAPVILEADYSFENLSFLMARDNDSFNCYEAAQKMGTRILLSMAKGQMDLNKIPESYLNAFLACLDNKKLDENLKSYALKLPEEEVLHLEGNEALILPLFKAKDSLNRHLGKNFKAQMTAQYLELYGQGKGSYKLDPVSIGRRALKNSLLQLLAMEGKDGLALALKQYKEAENMTDQIGAMTAVLWYGGEAAESVSAQFYAQWKHEGLVIQKWIAAHAMIPNHSAIDWVKKIEKDPVFDKKIPNFVRSLYRSFMRNYSQFHAQDGKGYEFIAERIVEIDKINPQMASGLAKGFSLYARLGAGQKAAMKKALEKILVPNLSKNTYEIVSKTLGQ